MQASVHIPLPLSGLQPYVVIIAAVVKDGLGGPRQRLGGGFLHTGQVGRWLAGLKQGNAAPSGRSEWL